MQGTYLVGQSSVPLARPVFLINILGPYLPYSQDVHRGGSGYPRSSEPTGGQESAAGPDLEAPPQSHHDCSSILSDSDR